MIAILYVAFWTLTYIFIILAGYGSRHIKMVSMPYIAGIMNLAWEICAVITNPKFWGYYPWILLDLIIAYIGYRFLNNKKERQIYIIVILLTTALLYFCSILSKFTFILSVYFIDLIMAILYILQFQKISPTLKITIAITRLFGDLFAAVEVLQSPLNELYPLVISVLICNITYFIMAIIEKTKKTNYSIIIK